MFWHNNFILNTIILCSKFNITNNAALCVVRVLLWKYSENLFRFLRYWE